MKKFMTGCYQMTLNIAEVAIIYLATFKALPWAMNIAKFYIILYFGVALLAFLVTMGAVISDNVTKNLKTKETVIKPSVYPRWIGKLFDIANIVMLIANGWWFFGSMHLASLICTTTTIALFKDLNEKLKAKELSDPSKLADMVKLPNHSSMTTRRLRPVSTSNHRWYRPWRNDEKEK